MSKRSESAHMGRVAALGCIICGDPAQVHHMRGCKRNNWLTIPLCPEHHVGSFSIHMDRRAFEAVYGDETALLALTIEGLHNENFQR